MVTWIRAVLAIMVCALVTAPAVAAERTFDKHFDAPPGGKLTLDADVGSIVVVGREGHQLSVHADLSGFDDFAARMQITATQTSDGVTVTGRATSHPWLDWLFEVGHNKVRYTIEVPRDYPVNLHTAGGSLDVRHLNASLHGTTSGGSVTIQDVSGSISARTSGGHIDARQVNGPTVLRTSGGSIEVEDATGDLDLHTSGGGIYLERIDGKVQASTSGGRVAAKVRTNRGLSLVTAGGSIALQLPANVHGSIDAHTSGGSTRSAIPLSTTEIASRTELRGAINGGGEPIFLRTSGGSIFVGPLD
jgi:hypothetical protein